jgi:hypothetical protein
VGGAEANRKYATCIVDRIHTSVVNPHQLDANPHADLDPDSTYHPYADLDADPILIFI